MLRSSGFYGGPERQIHQHALAARGSDYTVIIGAFAVEGRTPDLLRTAICDKLETHQFDVRNNYDPAIIRQLRRYLIDFKIDILATHDYRASLIGYLAVKGTNCHWLAWSRGWTYEGPKVAFFQFLEKIVVRFADRVLVVAQSQQEKLSRYLVPKSKFVVIHNAVDPERLVQTEAVDLRKKFSLPCNSIVVVSAGRFSAEKGQLVLLHSVGAVLSAVPHLYFVLFGDGPQLEQIRLLARNHESGNHIICPGFEENIIGHIRGADILVNPSLTEGLPNVVLEAMALRIPTIATSVGGVPELITNNHDGRLVSPNNPSALAHAIIDLATDTQLRNNFGKEGQKTVVNRFSCIEHNRKLLRTYSDILSD